MGELRRFDLSIYNGAARDQLSVCGPRSPQHLLVSKYHEKRTDRLDSDVRDQIKAMSGDMRDQLKTMSGDMQSQLSAMKVSLTGLRANMLRLCGQKRAVDKTCKIEELIATAKSVTGAQAEFFDAANVTFDSGVKPRIVSEGLAQQLPPVSTWSASEHTDSAGKPALANLILWSSAAESVKWHQEGNIVKAKFANGVASFKIRHAVSRDTVAELVDSMNETSAALQSTTVDPKLNK